MKNFKEYVEEKDKENWFKIFRIDGYSVGNHGLSGHDETPASPEEAFKRMYWYFDLKHKETEDLLKGSPMVIHFRTSGSFHEYFLTAECFVEVADEYIAKVKQIESIDVSGFESFDGFYNHQYVLSLGGGKSYTFNGLKDAVTILIENYTNGKGKIPKGIGVPTWANLSSINPVVKNNSQADSYRPKPGEDRDEYWKRQINNAKPFKRTFDGD